MHIAGNSKLAEVMSEIKREIMTSPIGGASAANSLTEATIYMETAERYLDSSGLDYTTADIIQLAQTFIQARGVARLGGVFSVLVHEP